MSETAELLQARDATRERIREHQKKLSREKDPVRKRDLADEIKRLKNDLQHLEEEVKKLGL